MEGKRKKGIVEDSLVVEEGMLEKFPPVPLAICRFHLQLLLQGSFHHEEVKQPICWDTQRPKNIDISGGSWGKSCWWIGSVWGDTAQERESGFTPIISLTKLSSLCKCLASTKFGSTVKMCLPARVVARSSTLTTSSTDTIGLCVASLTTGRVFPTSSSEARTTIEEIILNLNVWGEEEKKRTVLASSRKRQTSSTLSNGNLLCWFLINLFV